MDPGVGNVFLSRPGKVKGDISAERSRVVGLWVVGKTTEPPGLVLVCVQDRVSVREEAGRRVR